MGYVSSPADEVIPRHPSLYNPKNSKHPDVRTGVEVARSAGESSLLSTKFFFYSRTCPRDTANTESGA